VKPPDSNYPTRQAGTLVTLDEARNAFPKIRGVSFPPMMNTLERLDFGPAFRPEGGRLLLAQPKSGASYAVFVPRPNEDGLDVGGVRPLEIRAPLGTHTGWNVRAKASRGPNLCALDGSFIAFPLTREQRASSGDPRRSLEERYGTHDGYVRAVKAQAQALVTERFLLEEDAARFVREAENGTVLADR
jgi:hypothetical protein